MRSKMNDNILEVVGQLSAEVREKLNVSAHVDDLTVTSVIENVVLESVSCKVFTNDEKKLIVESIFNRMRRYDVLQPLLEDESITEIMINGPESVFIERQGRLELSGVKFESAERLETIVQQIVSDVDRKVNRSEPIADARLKDGSRVSVVLPPIALDGAAVTIRKFGKNKLTMEMLLEYGAIDKKLFDFLECMVKTRHNILICGGTGSGKTTFLNALSDAIPKDERVVTIEDSAELRLDEIPNLIRMETRSAGKTVDSNITMKDLIKASLRMRPDRIIVGEVRGEEALDMLQAMNTGHEGSITTGHSNSGPDMLHRLETMILSGSKELPLHSIRTQIASGLDIIIYLRRFKNGSRRVVTVDEVVEFSGDHVVLNTLFTYNPKSGYIQNSKMRNAEKMDSLV